MDGVEFLNFKKPAGKGDAKDKPKKEESAANPILNFVRNISQLMSTKQLYGPNHKIFKEHLKSVFPKVNKLLLEKQSVSFWEAENSLLVNRQKVNTADGLTRRFLRGLHDLNIGYLILEAGLTLEEFAVFIQLLCGEEALKGEEKVKKYLEGKSVKHIVIRSGTYQLIEDKEEKGDTKKQELLAVEELSFEIRNRFLEDLRRGEVVKQLKKEEEKYKALAHNPLLLSKVVFDLVKNKNNPEELAKVLWLIGDYLIGEIDSAKAEKFNKKAIEELKKQILLLWKEKTSNEETEKHIQKTFAAISLALQLKSSISLYEKHKKNMRKNAKKIREIMETLPQEGQLYQQTKEKLDKMHFSLEK